MATPAEKRARYFLGGSSEDGFRGLRQPPEAPSPSQGSTCLAWEQHEQQHHMLHHNRDFPASPSAIDDEKSLTTLALSTPPAAGDLVGGCSPAMAVQYHGQQERPHQQSVIGAVIAEAAERRSLRSQSQLQQSRDTDVVRRGTPMSENRQAVAEPRLLWSDLDADGPTSSAVEKSLPQEGGGGGLNMIHGS